MSSISRARTAAIGSASCRDRRLRKIQEAGLGYLFCSQPFGILAPFEFIPVFYGFSISLCTNYKIKSRRRSCVWGASPYYLRAFKDSECGHFRCR